MKKLLLLMSVFFMALSFTACSDDDEPNPEPQPIPENTLVLDGVNKSIKETIIEKEKFDQDIYVLKFQTSDEFELKIQATRDLHAGKVIDLTKPEIVSGIWSWGIELLERPSHTIFKSYGHPKVGCKHFSSGTLFIKCLEYDYIRSPIFEVKIQNAKIKDDKNGDGKEHTLEFYWKGSVSFPK